MFARKVEAQSCAVGKGRECEQVLLIQAKQALPLSSSMVLHDRNSDTVTLYSSLCTPDPWDLVLLEHKQQWWAMEQG